MKMIEMKM